MSIDGGYYGPATNEVAFAQLNGTALLAISNPNNTNVSTPRRLNVVLPNLLSSERSRPLPHHCYQ